MKNDKSYRQFEYLEPRTTLSSVGWDGAGRGHAELTYNIGNAPSYLNQSTIESAVKTALDAWSKVADITFTPTTRTGLKDSIDISFGRIDGSGGTLAQAYLPDDVNSSRIAGDIVFDTSERWEVGNGQGNSAFDLVLVAVHELGHALGLDHSRAANSVMADSVSPNQRFSGLAANDVDQALALYAPAKTNNVSTNPTSTNHGGGIAVVNPPTNTTPTTNPPTNDSGSGFEPRWTGSWFNRFQRGFWWMSRPTNRPTITWESYVSFNSGDRFVVSIGRSNMFIGADWWNS